MAANHWRDEGYAPFCNPKNFQKESTHVPHVPHMLSAGATQSR